MRSKLDTNGVEILLRVDMYLSRYNAPELRHVVRELIERVFAEMRGVEYVETPYTPDDARRAPWGTQTCNHWSKTERGNYVFCLRPVGHDDEHWPEITACDSASLTMGNTAPCRASR